MRGGGGEQASGPRAARRTGDRQAGDGRIVIAASDRRRRAVVTRPLLTSKASGARLSVSGGGRHVARREGDKCASYGSLFIGQSSGTQVETEHGRRKAGGAETGAGGRKDEIRFRFQKRLRAQRNFGFATKSVSMEMGLLRRPNSHLAGLLMFS